jgi:hypothetical protein
VIGHKCWLGILTAASLLKKERERSLRGCSAASPGIPIGEMTRGIGTMLASLSRALSIAALPEAATPKSSAAVEALAVIIGITNRVNYGLWQSA